jgi:uracil-DNA glycosylase family 4
MNKYRKFDKDLRECRRCESILAEYTINPCVSDDAVIPRPVAPPIEKRPILLIGQAPGLKEYETQEPFQGPAGQKIRTILADAGVNDFETQVYSSAVVKCYPGRKYKKKDNPRAGSQDRLPSARMVRNCRPFLERQTELVEPDVIITLGSFPLKEYLFLSGQAPRMPKLEEYVGRSQRWDGTTVVFFPHTSGGARWLNDETNKKLFQKATRLLRKVLIGEGIVQV